MEINSAMQYEDDNDEDDVCRICRNPGDADNPLRYPCSCKGSIKFVHQDCLLQWISYSKAHQCEVCKRAFTFSPVYADDVPSRLPFRDFMIGIWKKNCHVLKFFLRLSSVLSVWLLIIPFFTFWIWKLAFVRSFSEAKRFFLSHMSLTVILSDVLHGFFLFLLFTSIMCIFWATSLRDYFGPLFELGRLDRNGARALRRPVGQGNRNLADDAEDVPLGELFGMQGPIFHIVEYVFRILRREMIFVGVVIFVPFSLGRLILHYVVWLVNSATYPVLSSVMPLADSALSLANIILKNMLKAVTNLKPNNLVDQVNEMMSMNATALNFSPNYISTPLASDTFNGMTTGTSKFSDVATLAVGYMVFPWVLACFIGFIGLPE